MDLWYTTFNFGEYLNPFNTNKIQTFQIKCLRQIAKASFFVSNDYLHRELNILTTQNAAKIFYIRFLSNFSNHRDPLISNLSIHTIPGDLSGHLNGNGVVTSQRTKLLILSTPRGSVNLLSQLQLQYNKFN